jgi:hypothetical protein
VRATLKQLHSPDVSDLESWSPADANFGILLQAMIGPQNGEGFESFDILLCTPGYLASKMVDREIRSGEHTLFVTRYDYRRIRAYLERAIHRAEAMTWRELALRLSWLGRWEFAE